MAQPRNQHNGRLPTRRPLVQAHSCTRLSQREPPHGDLAVYLMTVCIAKVRVQGFCGDTVYFYLRADGRVLSSFPSLDQQVRRSKNAYSQENG